MQCVVYIGPNSLEILEEKGSLFGMKLTETLGRLAPNFTRSEAIKTACHQSVTRLMID